MAKQYRWRRSASRINRASRDKTGLRFESLEARTLLTVSVSTTAPAINDADIANLAAAGPSASAFDPGGEEGHIWSNRPLQGQTFRTGSNAAGYLLRAVTLQNEENTVTNNTNGFTVRVGTVNGNVFSAIRTQTATNAVSYVPNNFMTFTFTTPVTLQPNTTYGFDWRATGTGFTTWANADTAYAGGTAYSSGTNGVPADNALVLRGIDRVFHVDMVLAGPPASLQVVAANPTNGQTLGSSPATATIDFNYTVDAASVAAGDLQVNGIAATGVTIVDTDTLRFNLPALSPGTHNMTIAAGAMTGTGNVPFGGFSASFTTVQVAEKSISINFEGRTAAPTIQVATGGVAGASPTVGWNNIDGTTNVTGSFGPFNVTGKNGEQATLLWSANGTWSTKETGNRNLTTLPVLNNHANMMDGHIEGSGTGQASATVSGLSDDYVKYDVYVYVGDDAGGRLGELRFNGGPIQNFTSKIFDGTYTLGRDYFLFEDVTADSFVVTVEPKNDDNNNRTGIRGIQIIGQETMQVTATTPAAGAVLATSPANVRVDFNRAVVLGSVQASDLVVDNGAVGVSGFSQVDADTLQFTLAGPLAAGAHAIRFAPGALLGAGDLPLEAFEATFTVAALPAVQNTAATNINAVSAVLGGSVTSTGFDTPAVTLYYGTADGGANAAAWQHAVPLGAQAGAFSTAVSGLNPTTNYFFRTAASNVAGTAWAPSSATFATPAVAAPNVSILAASNVTALGARLAGEITNTGGQTPTVTFFFGTTDGGTNPAAWSRSTNVGTQSGVFSADVAGLASQATYYVRARAVNSAGTAWSNVSTFTTRQFIPATVVINELHYNPDLSTDAVEFVELHNAGDEPVALEGWRFSEGIEYTFPAGTMLPAGGYVVVAENPAELMTKYGATALGPYVGKLSNDGEEIVLRDSNGNVHDRVDYQLGFPWPTVGGSPGYSIELINPSLDNDLGGSWRASTGTATPPDPGAPPLISAGSQWKYFKGIQEPSAQLGAWRQIGFNDTTAGWITGTAPVGYGDGHVVTPLADMNGTYSTVYFRKTITVADKSTIGGLRLEAQFDDGINVWINGVRVLTENVLNAETPYNGTAVEALEDTTYQAFVLANPQTYLVDGVNVIAVQLLNSSLAGSSDAWFDARLIPTAAGTGAGAGPSPGAINSVFAENAAPQMRQVDHSPKSPKSGEDVTITVKVTDPNGVTNVTLDYQLVDPGAYIRLTDPAYATNWTTVTMRDDGLGGDAFAGDDVFSVTLPGTLQTDRRLVRYRITSTDFLGASVRGPYADDPQPNFAYFVYDGVPDWTGSLRPGVSPPVTYGADALSNIAVYQLIANETDVNNSQYNGTYNLQQFRGTFVYDGEVYDHVEYRNRGRASNYQVGKNKWKINFTRGHGLEARDNYGNKYDQPLDKINILPGTNPWWRNDVSTEGTVLSEPVSFKLYDLAGTPSPNTNYFHFRVIDNAQEASPTSQYEGDFWGLYISIEQPEGEFLRERDLPDGNIFNMHGVAGASQRSQGSELPTDKSDLTAFVNGYKSNQTLAWWDANLNYDSYFAWYAINRAVNNGDLRPEENVNYYHNQETGEWYTIPWDMDLTFEDAPHWSRPPAQFEDIDNVFAQHPSVRLAYQNYVRELQDLLFDSGDAARVVEEMANILEPGFNQGTQIANSIVEANQAMWDYHPRKVKPGIWYANYTPALLPQRTFDAMESYMEAFLRPGGYGYNLLVGDGIDAAIPNRPTISYTGDGGFPIDGLSFQTSSFSDPQGAGTFAKIEWRLAEVHNADVAGYDPTKNYEYEIEGTWESGELTTFGSQITVPALVAEAGKTYRARVRMQDNTGRWSHWSLPVEFTASPPTPTDVVEFLRISEFNYHPAIDGDAEFIEFKNISAGASAVTLDLSGVTITKGPSSPFTFAEGTLLGAGEYLLVVRSMSAFVSAYPHVDVGLIAGAYAGGLDNAGETIEVLDALGNIVHDFRYEDGGAGEEAWHPTTDGFGPSMVIVNENAFATTWSQGSAWRPSYELGGSPGEPDCLSGDLNCDGAVNLNDLAILQANLGTGFGATRALGDMNYDGAVNRLDAALLAQRFGAFVVNPGSSPAAASAAALVAGATGSREEPARGGALVAGGNRRPVVQAVERRRLTERTGIPTLTANAVDSHFDEVSSSTAMRRSRIAAGSGRGAQTASGTRLVTRWTD